ncbi:taste receptor type 2 member 3 [Erinaceus europaeus]|uniref:Taste receptor type 2 n=1 Tax=Erinaceus europaeus TaxID=9365 RepID=A0A1S3AB51_ERIEU|nr:taste receptor type 2 member 3 [Erinaceus europaeus]
MAGFLESLFLALTVIFFILGMLGNGFIGLVNGSRWVKSKRISLSDFIITALTLSRVILLWILLADSTLIVFFYRVHNDGMGMKIIDISWTFINHLSIWLVTSLSVLYCLKIASFSHPMFLWLKWRVSRVVVWMLLGALLLSCGSTMSLVREFEFYSLFYGFNGTEDPAEHLRKKTDYEVTHTLGILWDLFPFIVSLASNTLLILSLRRHTRQMQQNGSCSRDTTTEAHQRAIRIILSYLLLFLFYYLAFLITYCSRFLPETKMIKMFGEAVTLLYPAGHSFILIMGNKKLKQMFVQILRCQPGHLKPGPKGTVDSLK